MKILGVLAVIWSFGENPNGQLSALVAPSSFSCYDGSNGGCSHICSGGVCSCPSCWTLNDDGKTCSISAGKATVTCSSSGMELEVDKCVVPDVEQGIIHLKDSVCGAVGESDSTWKLTTGFANCGSELGFFENKLTVENTLMIGNAIVDGMRRVNKYEVNFACKYNNVATASKLFNAVSESVSFDINDEAPAELSFGFTLQPYETNDFATKANLTAGSVLIGSPVYMRVSPENTLPESLEFSVHHCTVEDKIIDQKISILDSCPLEGLDFLFKNGQSDQSAVDFSFKSFVFPSSAENTVIELSCDINICPLNSAECLKSCSPTENAASTSPADTALLIFRADRDISTTTQILAGDGSSMTSTNFNFPYEGYLWAAKFAVVKDVLHIFGGYDDRQKIAKLEGCNFVELSARLNFPLDIFGAALAIDNKALVCFDLLWYETERNETKGTLCDSFDGTAVASTFSTAYPHIGGSLGIYKGQPTTVSGNSEAAEDSHHVKHQKVETLSTTGWTSLADLPRYSRFHNLVGLETGSMFLIGGLQVPESVPESPLENTVVWILHEWNGKWATAGNLKKAIPFSSSIRIGDHIYVVPGVSNSEIDTYEDGFPVQRIDLEKGYIIASTTSTVIETYQEPIGMPVLYHATFDICV